MSPRDLNTLELLPKICETGISSLKLEGRMKRPEYVATVVRIYRQVLDRLKQHPDHFYVLPKNFSNWLKSLTVILPAVIFYRTLAGT